MGVSTTTNTMIYQGDGISNAFSFPYYFFRSVDLAVYLYDSILGTITPQILGTNYTVSGTQNFQGLYPNGGSVNFVVVPAVTQMIWIGRTPAEVQNYALQQNGTISSAAIVQAFDNLQLQIQSLQDQLNRCVQLPAGMGPAFSTVLPGNLALPASANQYLQINALATGLTVVPNVAWASRTYSYTDMVTSGNQITLPMVLLPPTAILIGVCFKHDIAFAGSGLTNVYLSAGPAASPAQFIPYFPVSSAPGDQNFSYVNPQFLASWATSQQMVIKATSVGGNLSALSQGRVTVYYNYQFI